MSRIVILGGGFAGVACAGELSRKAPADVEVVLFNTENHLVFSPLLAEVAGSSINELDVVVPLRQLLKRVFCRTEEVTAIDLHAHRIRFEAEDGAQATLDYDHLVIACGNVTNMNAVPGMADHALPLKTIGDASRLRSQVVEQMELAEVTSDSGRRRQRLTFLVVGGGYSGVETAGELNDLVRDSARYFRNWKAGDVRVVLIHSGDQILPEISSGLRDFARAKMEKAGVEIVLRARAAAVRPEGVELEDGRFIKGGTIVCTIGGSPAPVVAALEVTKQKGRLVTGPEMRLRGFDNAWAVGDCAFTVNAYGDSPSPTTGQFAERQGRQCARNILAALRQRPTRPFYYRQLGELCSIGGHSAVADLFGLHISGFLAWFLWRGIYLFKLPTLARRMQVGFDWAWLLLFPRDLANVRTQPTDRVVHARYRPGDFIFREGETPDSFYVLEHGEVEVLPARNGGHEEVAAVLGPGSFFGERALLNKAPRLMSVRARTDAQVLVMGKHLFSQVSEALGPLRDALAQTLNRRAIDAWPGASPVSNLLQGYRVSQAMEPVPQPVLRPTATLREVAAGFARTSNEFFFVSGDSDGLEGVVTVTDLIRARNSGATPATPARDFMTPGPVAVTADDTCAAAADLMSEFKLKTLPVVKDKQSKTLLGCLRARRLIALVFEQASAKREDGKELEGTVQGSIQAVKP